MHKLMHFSTLDLHVAASRVRAGVAARNELKIDHIITMNAGFVIVDVI